MEERVKDNGLLARSNWTPNRKRSMEYSRHLCGVTRSSSSMLMGNTRTRAFSYPEATAFTSHTYHGQYDAFRKRNLTLAGRQGSAESLTKQIKVYSMDKRFRRKFGPSDTLDKTQDTSELLPLLQIDVSRESPTYSVQGRKGDDERSYCDSVLSFACSGFTNSDVHKRTSDEKLQNRAKFDAIENWLQTLPGPDL